MNSVIINRSTHKIKQEDYNAVIGYFNNNIENKTSTIAKKLNLNMNYVNYMIDFYLSKKANYNGARIMDNNFKII
jgi:hypothetical protein